MVLLSIKKILTEINLVGAIVSANVNNFDRCKKILNIDLVGKTGFIYAKKYLSRHYSSWRNSFGGCQ